MSRVTGISLDAKADYRADLVESMMAASRSDVSWAVRSESFGKATFGWTGRRTPNLSATKGIIVALEGYIYNRAELGSADTDAALLAWLYQRHGLQEALLKINGDFAAAIYDSEEDTLWLARDRIGVKPLYYASHSGRFAFASRPGALLTLPWVRKDVNRRFVALFAASHYRYFDNRPNESPYADIVQLPAAHMLRLSHDQLTTSRYWSLEDKPDFVEPEVELADRYRDLLMDAVSLRLESAPRPAFTLSGGMDSSSVLASAARLSSAKQHAFSAVYADETYDESAEIRPMVDASVESWHPVAIDSPDVFGLVQRMVSVHDEPVATATWLSHFLLCEDSANQQFGSLFGGLGGDELNAGEYEYFPYHFADLRAAGLEDQLAREVEMWVHYHDHPVFRKSFDLVEKELSRLVNPDRPGKFPPDCSRLRRYASALNRDYFDLDDFEPAMDYPFQSYLKNRTYQDIFLETAPCCLRAEDRQTTAFGLDHFLPFFDHRLVEFMFRVPGALKIRNGVTKHLLRRAMQGLLPEETRTRVKKTGWNAPAHLWFYGAGREPLLDMVSSRAFRERGIYNLDEVNRLIDEHQEIVRSGRPQENHMMFLWQLVNLEVWLSALDGQGGKREET